MNFTMFSDKRLVCDQCKLDLLEETDQYLGYHKDCLGIPEDEQQQLQLLKKRIIELLDRALEKFLLQEGYIKKGDPIRDKNKEPGYNMKLLDYDIENGAVVQMNIISFNEAGQTLPLGTIPEPIAFFPKLKKLSIGGAGMELTTIPGFLQDMDQLEELELLDNGPQIAKITNIYVFQEMKALKKLDLRYNEIYSIPEELFELTTLTELDLSTNVIEKLSESISKLVNLEKLDLSENRLRKIPESIGELHNLKYLDISNQGKRAYPVFDTIPDSIGNLERLEVLLITNNKNVTSVPETIGKLKNLRVLDLSDNNLGNLPESISKLQNLTGLSLGRNNLTKLPDTLDQLVNLEDVYLTGNKFEEVPNFLIKLKKGGKLKRVGIEPELKKQFYEREPDSKSYMYI